MIRTQAHERRTGQRRRADQRRSRVGAAGLVDAELSCSVVAPAEHARCADCAGMCVARSDEDGPGNPDHRGGVRARCLGKARRIAELTEIVPSPAAHLRRVGRARVRSTRGEQRYAGEIWDHLRRNAGAADGAEAELAKRIVAPAPDVSIRDRARMRGTRGNLADGAGDRSLHRHERRRCARPAKLPLIVCAPAARRSGHHCAGMAGSQCTGHVPYGFPGIVIVMPASTVSTWPVTQRASSLAR